MSSSEPESVWFNPLVQHLAAVLAVKVLLLAALWWFFFRVPEATAVSFDDVHTHIAGPKAPVISLFD